MEKLSLSKSNLSVLSLFSGGGFLDIGFMNQGFQISEAVEFHEPFVNCYNEGISSYVKGSQKKVYKNGEVSAFEIFSPLDATSSTVQRDLVKKCQDVTGIIGGPPCQDFSIGGKNKGTEGNRGKLIFTYLEIIKQTKPLFIFFENVAGLYNNKEHQVGFYKLKNELEKEYFILYDILNSLDYGIPQDRERLTMVGFRKDVVTVLINSGYKIIKTPESSVDEMVFNWPEKKFKDAKKIQWPKTWNFRSGINQHDIDLIPKKYISLFVEQAFLGISDETPNQLEQFNPYSKKFKLIKEGDTNRKSFKRLHRYRYSPTVAYGNNEVHLHPTEPRRLSVREALRLQSVPDGYVLPSNVWLTHKFKLISNGVPTKKAELIAKEIKRTLDNYYSVV